MSAAVSPALRSATVGGGGIYAPGSAHVADACGAWLYFAVPAHELQWELRASGLVQRCHDLGATRNIDDSGRCSKNPAGFETCEFNRSAVGGSSLRVLKALFTANSGRRGQSLSNHSVRCEILQTVSAEFSGSEKSSSCTTDFCWKISFQAALSDRCKAAQQIVFCAPLDLRRFARTRRSCVRFPCKFRR